MIPQILKGDFADSLEERRSGFNLCNRFLKSV